MYKEKIKAIMEAINTNADEKNRMAYISAIQRGVQDFPDYVNAVVTMEAQIVIANVRYADEPDEFKDVVRRLDQNRRNNHLALVGTINLLNRICKIVNVEPFYTCDFNGVKYGVDKDFDEETDCRRMAAECAKDFVDDLWYEGRFKAQNKDLLYDTSQIHQAFDAKEVMLHIDER